MFAAASIPHSLNKHCRVITAFVPPSSPACAPSTPMTLPCHTLPFQGPWHACQGRLSMTNTLLLLAAVVPHPPLLFAFSPLGTPEHPPKYLNNRVPGLFAFLRRRYPQICSPVEKKRQGHGDDSQQGGVDNLYIGRRGSAATVAVD